jgi:ribosomal protein L11 methyltransferase
VSAARWIVLTVRAPSEELMTELAEGLVALGGLAVEQEADRLTTYVPEPAAPAPFLEHAAARLAAIVGGPPELRWRWQADEDWAARWKDGLVPRRVGSRIVVTQPWSPAQPEGNDVVIVIDPSSAFGTGEHATTRGCLRLLEVAVTGGDRVLDVGAGTAILSIAAVLLGAASALAVESDPGALDPAAVNVARAGLEDRVELVNAVVDAGYLAQLSGLDLIVANVLSGVLMPLLPSFRTALADGGRVIVGGVLAREAPAFGEAAAAAGLRLRSEDREDEWWAALMAAAA